MKRQDSTEYILYLSYGKDSLACLEAIKRLGYPLDRIVHAEVWATDTIPADLPPMVEFKARADKIIKERYGIEVEHIYAVRGGSSPMNDNSTSNSVLENSEETSTVFPSLSERGVIVNSKSQQCQKLTYEDIFYREIKSRGGGQRIYGFPMLKGQWCNSYLKMSAKGRLRVLQQDGANIAQENSNVPYLRIPNINRERKLVYTTQNKGFLKAPPNKAQRKILFGILELPLMNQKELIDTQNKVKYYLLLI